jgi:creatinine amidohydrolase
MTLRVQEMTWVDFDEKRKVTDLAIIPTGAIEVYGPHLPLGSDSIVAYFIAQKLGEETGGLVFPLIPVGYSKMLADFPGTLNVEPYYLYLYLKDICGSIVNWGFKRLFFINTHLGNVPVINNIGEDLKEKYGVKCAQVDWWRFVKGPSEGVVETGDLAHGHASETGTSVMLYINENFVKREREVNTPPNVIDKYPDIIKYPSFKSISPNGIVGNPCPGSKEKGEQIIKRAIQRMAEFIKQEF